MMQNEQKNVFVVLETKQNSPQDGAGSEIKGALRFRSELTIEGRFASGLVDASQVDYFQCERLRRRDDRGSP